MARWQDVNGIYHIYPRSFKDTNGDGVGDLAGITQKLDYIKGTPDSLGIDAIWLSPFYRSPMADFGYDVSDYYSVDPLFGDLEDFKTLLTEAHNRDIKVMVDYVANHTSSEHPWFVASKSSRENEKRDWYIWRDPKPDGSPPNNWLSVFGGSAWQLDEATGQYYLHSFLAKQPDLNWENPAVRKAMLDVLHFWLALGVDGIRADAVRWMSKDLTLKDNELNPEYLEGHGDPYHSQLQHNSRYGQKLFDYLGEIAGVVEQYADRIILFEDYLDRHFDKTEQYNRYYSVNPTVAAPFNFEGINTAYTPAAFRSFIATFQKVVGDNLRPFYCFSNHDVPRLASRMGARQAKLIGMLQLTLPGIPVVYYGDELGMQNGHVPPEAVRDPFEQQTPGLDLGRDPQRTPMQWSSEEDAGFSTGRPWLPATVDAEINVEHEQADEHSSLSMYKALLELRRSAALRNGTYKEWPACTDTLFGFTRQSNYETILVLLNMSENEHTCAEIQGEVIYSTHAFVEQKEGNIVFQPHQGVVIRLAR